MHKIFGFNRKNLFLRGRAIRKALKCLKIFVATLIQTQECYRVYLVYNEHRWKWDYQATPCQGGGSHLPLGFTQYDNFWPNWWNFQGNLYISSTFRIHWQFAPPYRAFLTYRHKHILRILEKEFYITFINLHLLSPFVNPRLTLYC